MNMLITFFFLFFSFFTPSFPEQSIELPEALKKRLVEVSDQRGLGGHQGPSVVLSLKNVKKSPLRVKVPLGLLLEPADTTEQTLAVASSEFLALQAGKTVRCTLSTYCTQAGDASPRVGAGFRIGAMAPSKLVELIAHLSKMGLTESADAQAAVWCVANGHSPAYIGDPALRAFTAKLMGQKPPDLRVYREIHEVPGEPALPEKALAVEGQYRFFLEKDDKLSLILFDKAGKAVHTVFKNEKSIAGEHRTSIRLKVFNLQPGDYVLRLVSSDGTVLQETNVSL